ncbi:MAG: NAD(P)-dependent oxidoreductase [bacterium]
MKIAIFDLQPHEKKLFNHLMPQHKVVYFKESVDEADLSKIKDFDVISVFVTSKVNSEIIKKFPKLKLIATRSTGFDHVDLKVCKKKKITVCNVPAYGENTVAEHAFALLLSLARKIPDACLMAMNKKFDQKALKGCDLHEKTIGVIGAGKIGKNVIKIAHGFGMEILAYDIKKDKLLSEILDFKYTDIKTLLKKSDIISLHAPYNKLTHHMLNKKNMKFIKRGAIFINTARGGLVETDALIKALENKTIIAAGLDVLEEENLIIKNQKPTVKQKEILNKNKKLLSMKNVLFTPHIAFNTCEAVERITETTIENMLSFQAGQKINTVE